MLDRCFWLFNNQIMRALAMIETMRQAIMSIILTVCLYAIDKARFIFNIWCKSMQAPQNIELCNRKRPTKNKQKKEVADDLSRISSSLHGVPSVRRRFGRSWKVRISVHRGGSPLLVLLGLRLWVWNVGSPSCESDCSDRTYKKMSTKFVSCLSWLKDGLDWTRGNGACTALLKKDRFTALQCAFLP